MVTSLKISRGSWWKPLLGLLLLALWIGSASFALADASQDNLKQANVHIDKALAAAKANDFATAKTELQAFDDEWFNFEDTVRAKSKGFYIAIEDKMDYVKD